VDTQPAPLENTEGSVLEAEKALIGLINPTEEETEEVETTEEEESTEETQDETPEEESEEEESEEGEEPEEDEEDLLYAVKIDGEEQEVTLEELTKGYSRQSSYTRKSQELAEHRKEFETAKEQMVGEYNQIQQERTQYVQALQQLMENQMGALGQWNDVNWEQMKNEDPIEYVTKKEEYREAQDNFNKVQQEQQRVQQISMADNQKQHQEMVQREFKALVDVLPEWGEPEKQKSLAKDLKSYATDSGFSKEEIDALVDHRSLLMLRKAFLYDRLQKTDVKGKKLKNKPRVVRSGTGRDKTKETKQTRTTKMQRLRKTGHVDDAVTVLEGLMENL